MDTQKKSLSDIVAAVSAGYIEMYGSIIGYTAEVAGIIVMAAGNKSGDLVAGAFAYLSGRLLNGYRQRTIAREELDERIMNLRYDTDSDLSHKVDK